MASNERPASAAEALRFPPLLIAAIGVVTLLSSTAGLIATALFPETIPWAADSKLHLVALAAGAVLGFVSLVVARRASRRIFPDASLRTLFVTLGLVVMSLPLTELFLYGLDEAGTASGHVRICTQEWADEDQRITTNMSGKNQANDGRGNLNWVWRSRGLPLRTPQPMTKRILVIGDSFVWGDGYSSPNDLWWRQLQRELRDRGYLQVEVLGAGMRGTSTRDQLEQVRRLIPSVAPDVVVWGYVTNDADMGLTPALDPALPDRDPIVSAHEVFSTYHVLPRLNYQLNEARRRHVAASLPIVIGGGTYHDWEMGLLSGENLASYGEVLMEIRALLSESAVPCFFVSLPNTPSWLPSTARETHRLVAPLFRSASLEFHDLLPALDARYPKGRNLPPMGWGINPANGHPGVLSATLYAEQVADLLERRYPDALGKRETSPHVEPVRIIDWNPWNLEITPLEGGASARFFFPNANPLTLQMPGRHDTVDLSLDMPSPIESIELSGGGASEATLWVNASDREDPLGSSHWASLGTRRGAARVWMLADYRYRNRVRGIRISGDFAPDDPLTLAVRKRTE